MIGLLVLLLLQSPQSIPATVRAELLDRGLPVPKGADLQQPITSYSVLDDNHGFVIAYYLVEPDGLLHALHIRSYDKRTRTWRARTIRDEIGSILKIERNAGLIYVSGHSSPSAAPTLVLTAALELKRELDGWPMLLLNDGRVVFQRSLVHFAPAHGGALALYDPAGNREQSLYPPPGVHNERGIEKVPGTQLLMDRSIDDVKTGMAPGTIVFDVVEQPMQLTQDNRGEPAGPERRLHVVCTIAASPPVCDTRARD
jgi:hypothetical protein